MLAKEKVSSQLREKKTVARTVNLCRILSKPSINFYFTSCLFLPFETKKFVPFDWRLEIVESKTNLEKATRLNASGSGQLFRS